MAQISCIHIEYGHFDLCYIWRNKSGVTNCHCLLFFAKQQKLSRSVSLVNNGNVNCICCLLLTLSNASMQSHSKKQWKVKGYGFAFFPSHSRQTLTVQPPWIHLNKDPFASRTKFFSEKSFFLGSDRDLEVFLHCLLPLWDRTTWKRSTGGRLYSWYLQNWAKQSRWIISIASKTKKKKVFLILEWIVPLTCF